MTWKATTFAVWPFPGKAHVWIPGLIQQSVTEVEGFAFKSGM